MLGAIGPYWDGNEVWLIAAGGVFFFAFPRAYAAAFSGLYLPLMIVLWLIILRGLSIELRDAARTPAVASWLRRRLRGLLRDDGRRARRRSGQRHPGRPPQRHRVLP